MVNSNTMDQLERLGFGADVDALEDYVAKLQNAAGLGNPLVPDAMYDACFKLLKELKPNSRIINRNWENYDEELNEYDKVLQQYGMCSIETVAEIYELDKFKQSLYQIGHPVELMASIKDNGHGVRAVYVNGYLREGSTRGRYKKGRDITRHLKAVLPNYVDAWKDIQVVEVRGEMLVSISNFEQYLKGSLKTPLSSVTSLIRESATDNEIQLLSMECYKVISSDGSLKFSTLWEEFEHLENCGFKTPPKALIKGVTPENLEPSVQRLLEYFEGLMDEEKIEYSCDGIVFAINCDEEFYSLGKDGNAWRGNFALKTGRYWESNVYSSEIIDVEFIPGKSYIVPKAKIEPVTASNGAVIDTVPLYNIGVMERYHYVPGETIFFHFGGEQGVIACDAYGRSVAVY